MDRCTDTYSIERQWKMLTRSRNDLVHGFIKKHSTRCTNDVESEIIRFYFDVSDLQTQPPLLTACKYGYYGLIRTLLETTNINTQNTNGATALHMAARSGFAEVCALLIKHCIDVNCAAKNGATAIFDAIHQGHISVVEVLSKHHADVNIYEKDEDGMFGITPLYIAVDHGDIEMVRVLVSHPKIDIDKGTDLVDCSPLASAAREGHASIVSILLSSGADVLRPNDFGVDPFTFAVANGEYEILKMLYENLLEAKGRRKANEHLTRALPEDYYDEEEDRRRPTGRTLLHYACKNGHTEVAKFLVVKAKADVLQTDSKGKTPIYYASEKGNVTLVSWLQAFADLNNSL